MTLSPARRRSSDSSASDRPARSPGAPGRGTVATDLHTDAEPVPVDDGAAPDPGAIRSVEAGGLLATQVSGALDPVEHVLVVADRRDTAVAGDGADLDHTQVLPVRDVLVVAADALADRRTSSTARRDV